MGYLWGGSNGFYSGFRGFPIGTPLNSVTRQVRSPTADGLPCTKLLPQVRRVLWLDQAASHMTGNDLNPLFWGRKISKSWAKSDKSGDDLLQSIFALWFRHAAGHIYRAQDPGLYRQHVFFAIKDDFGVQKCVPQYGDTTCCKSHQHFWSSLSAGNWQWMTPMD